MDTAFNSYALAVGETGERRLRAIDDLLAPSTRRLLETAGIRRGMRVLDIGCGVGMVSMMLAELVGPEGSVVGVSTCGHHLLDATSSRGQRLLPRARFGRRVRQREHVQRPG
jgi:2-polyprenyl-3-methyl-5-hydroxy-6-metoxy-1,4-benzoquinol methylase